MSSPFDGLAVTVRVQCLDDCLSQDRIVALGQNLPTELPRLFEAPE